MLAGVYLVSYLAFSIPAVIAGLAVTHYGLRDSSTVYAGVVLALAVAAAIATEVRLAAARDTQVPATLSTDRPANPT